MLGALIGLLLGAPGFALELGPCAERAIDLGALHQQLAIELDSSSTTAVVGFSLRLERCEPDPPAFLLGVEDRRTHLLLSGPFELSDVPRERRPRAVAIALAELWSTLSHRPGPPRPRSLAAFVPPLPSPISTLTPEPSIRWSAWFEGRVALRHPTTLLGGRVGVSHSLAELELAADLGAAFDRESDPLGTVELGLASGALGLYASAPAGAFSLAFGPRFELGWAWATGSSASERASAGSHGGPLLALGARATLAHRLFGELGMIAALEVAGIVKGLDAQADDRLVASLGGLSLAFNLGLQLDR